MTKLIEDSVVSSCARPATVSDSASDDILAMISHDLTIPSTHPSKPCAS